jgi:hypothetical protein
MGLFSQLAKDTLKYGQAESEGNGGLVSRLYDNNTCTGEERVKLLTISTEIISKRSDTPPASRASRSCVLTHRLERDLMSPVL